MYVESQEKNLNAWHHLGGMHLAYRITPRPTLITGDLFLATEDPSRRLTDSFFLLPRTTYRENALFFNLDYELTQLTTLTFRFDNTITTISLPGGARAGLFDQMGNSFTAGVARRLTPRQRLRATYSFLKFTPLDPETARRLNICYKALLNKLKKWQLDNRGHARGLNSAAY